MTVISSCKNIPLFKFYPENTISAHTEASKNMKLPLTSRMQSIFVYIVRKSVEIPLVKRTEIPLQPPKCNQLLSKIFGKLCTSLQSYLKDVLSSLGAAGKLLNITQIKWFKYTDVAADNFSILNFRIQLLASIIAPINMKFAKVS